MNKHILAFDFEEDWKQMNNEEKELIKKYMLNITKLEKEGKSQKEINDMIKSNHKKYLKDYKQLIKNNK